jgi:CIC family chloride channel protein
MAHHLLPGYTATPGAYALVGMGAVFAGIVRVPMTSVLMIFEMTRDYAVIVPLMIANMTSLFISRRFQKQPIYEALAHQDGIHLPSRSTRDEPNQRTVLRVMRRTPDILPAEMRVQDVIEQTRASKLRTWPVVEKDYFLGMLTKETLRCAFADGRKERLLKDLVETLQVPHLHTDHPLHLALERMSTYHLDVLPVVHRADIHKLEGAVSLPDVLDAYGIDCAGSD